MWKNTQDQPATEPQTTPRARTAAASPDSVARIGPSIRIKGSLTGEEDLLIQGVVEGEVTLGRNKVTIGEGGRVQADIRGSMICVEGEVKGNLFGEEQVIIRRSGKVRGNVTAPRVNLENGAKFKGAIDMQPGAEAVAAAKPATVQKPGPGGAARQVGGR